MKKLTLFLAMMFVTSILFVEAQVQTMHNPNAMVTVTNDQINAWGEAAKLNVSPFVILDFEGLSNLEEISQFYNGGNSSSGFPGTNHGISFSGSAMAIIDVDTGGTGNFANEPSPNTVMFFLKGCGSTINVSAGFTTAVSFYFTSSTAGTVNIYDGTDGTGNLLTTQAFLPTAPSKTEGDPTGYFSSWKPFAVTFSGTAKSVTFSGVENQCGFDDITFGRKTPGYGEVAKSKEMEPEKITQEASTFTSPTTKGKYLVAGSNRLELNVGGEKQTYGSSESKYSYFDFDFQPRVGYFVIDNLATGLFMDLDLYSTKAKDDTYFYKSTYFIIGPFARYYIPVFDKLVPYAEGQVGFGVDNEKSKYSSSDEWSKTNEGVFTFRLGGGATYFFNDVVGADLFLGFLHDSYKYKDTDTGGERASDSKYNYNEFIMQLGIVVILGN